MSNKEEADILRVIMDAYGIGVRGGVITPCLSDENQFREMMGLKPAGPEVIAEWSRSKGVRLPITLQRELSGPATANTENLNEQIS